MLLKSHLRGYLDRIFDPEELQAKQNLGNAITVSTFGTVLREFSGAFSDAAPQAKTFSEAMEVRHHKGTRYSLLELNILVIYVYIICIYYI